MILAQIKAGGRLCKVRIKKNELRSRKLLAERGKGAIKFVKARAPSPTREARVLPRLKDETPTMKANSEC